jgi:hypothetical protein
MLSPLWMKKSGRLRSTVAYSRMPPRDSSMPQPCPAVSPDHANVMERRSAGAVRKRPMTGSPAMVGDAKSSSCTR